MVRKGRPVGFDWFIKGKLAGMAMPYYADLAYLKEMGIGGLVTLTCKAVDRDMVEKYGLDYCHLPIPNFAPPSHEQIIEFVEFCDRKHEEGTAVMVHCLAGLGRTGTMLACYLVWTGISAGEAIREVRGKRPGAIETDDQEQAIYRFEDWLTSSGRK